MPPLDAHAPPRHRGRRHRSSRSPEPAAAQARPATPPKLPPAWFKHAFWRGHRAAHRLSRGRFLWTPASKRGWGALSLTTTGRRTGRDRSVIVGYLEDGPNVVVLAMNGWDEGHPAWWLNLADHPEATIQLPHRAPGRVRARAASGDECARLWARWLAIEPEIEAFAARRRVETPVIVFEPEVTYPTDGR